MYDLYIFVSFRKDLNLSPLKLLAIMELFILMPTEEEAEKLKFPKSELLS